LDTIYGHHFRVYKKLKSLLGDEKYTFPDGTEVSAAAIHHPTIRGRKFVIMGDTRSGENIKHLAKNADVVVHEATNAWIEGDEESKDTTPESLMRTTRNKGHSTPEMAGSFAKKISEYVAPSSV
jgi:ribonuclease Z